MDLRAKIKRPLRRISEYLEGEESLPVTTGRKFRYGVILELRPVSQKRLAWGAADVNLLGEREAPDVKQGSST